MMDEMPRLSERLRAIFRRLPELLRQVMGLIAGASATSAWVRLALVVVALPIIYLGMLLLIGELPDMFDNLGRFFDNLGRLITLMRELFFPQAPVVEGVRSIYDKLPKSPPQTPLLRWLVILIEQVGKDNIQEIVAFILLPLVWTLGLTIHIFEQTFQWGNRRSAIENLFAGLFPPLRRTMEARESSLVMTTTSIRPRRVGGPFRLAVDRDTLAVMEKRDGQVRLITATRGPVDIDLFERLHRLVDLREQCLELTHCLRTRDGIPATLHGAQFCYRVRRRKEPDGPDPVAARNLVYHHWLGKVWEDPQQRQQDVRWLIAQELEQFIGSRIEVDELMQYVAPQHLLQAYPLKRQVLQEFVEYFNSRREHGLQLTCKNEGHWELPQEITSDEALPALENSLHNQYLLMQLRRLIPHQYMEDEIRRLAGQVLELYARLGQQGADRKTIQQQLLAVYARILGEKLTKIISARSK